MSQRRQGKPQNKTKPVFGPVTFSFQYVDFKQSDKFALSKIVDENFLKRLFEKLKHASKQRVEDYKKEENNHYNEWDDLTEKGFTHLRLQPELKDKKPFQLTVTKKARIHGLWEGNVFCVVWFDPNHLLRPFDVQNKNKHKK